MNWIRALCQSLTADIIRDAGCVLLFWMGFQRVGGGAPPTSWSPPPPPPPPGTVGWADHNWIRKMEIRSIGALPAAARWLLFANYAANLCCSQHTVGRKYCGKWEERNNTVKWVKTITERRDIKSTLWTIFLLPSGEKKLPDVFQSVPVQC